jgi:TonB dependent receptor
MTHGKHNIRIGFEFNYVMQGTNSTGSSNGSFTFGSSWTQQTKDQRQSATDGSGVATLLLGYPTSGSISWNDNIYRTRPYYGVYIQDDWKLTPKLTLNMGLRYDVQIPLKERYNRENRGWDPYVKSPASDAVLAKWAQLKAQYDAANPNAKYPYPSPSSVLTGGYVFPGVNGQPSRLYNTDYRNIEPRLGVAYRIFDKTVIRAGAGIYYISPTQGSTTTGFQQGTPYLNSLDGGITPSAGNSLTGAYSLVNPFPNGIQAPTGSSLGILTSIGNGVSYDPPGFRIPRTYQYSFGIEQQLFRNIVAEISYAGNYQNHINFGQNLNHETWPNQTIAIADPSYYSRSLPNPFFGIVPIMSSLGGSASIAANNLSGPIRFTRASRTI